jgi:hypothetical protein
LKNKIWFVIATAILAVVLVGCAEATPAKPSSYDANAKANEQSVQKVIANDTLPQITRSLDRENIKKRMEFLNQPNRIGYLYLLSSSGQLIKEVQVQGKVTSLNAYLTPMEEVHIVDGIDCGQYCHEAPVVISAPDVDGTYGTNSDGVFWFTPDGVYQEWNGLSFYSAERLTFTSQPLLIESVNSK